LAHIEPLTSGDDAEQNADLGRGGGLMVVLEPARAQIGDAVPIDHPSATTVTHAAGMWK
jgi:hypothetical protein